MEKPTPMPKNESKENMIQGVKVGFIEETTADNRRVIYEFFNGENNLRLGSAKLYEIEQPEEGKTFELGHHANVNDHEIFVMIDGEADLTIEDKKTKEQKIFHLEQGSKVEIPSGVPHVFSFKDSALMLGLNEKPFKEENLEKYPIKIKGEKTEPLKKAT